MLFVVLLLAVNVIKVYFLFLNLQNCVQNSVCVCVCGEGGGVCDFRTHLYIWQWCRLDGMGVYREQDSCVCNTCWLLFRGMFDTCVDFLCETSVLFAHLYGRSLISRVSDQNGVSRLYIIVEITLWSETLDLFSLCGRRFPVVVCGRSPLFVIVLDGVWTILMLIYPQCVCSRCTL